MKDTPYYKQAQLLLRVLPLIYKQKEFALKGGTAINFFYRNLPRVSVDIDLTYLPIQDRPETLNNIDRLLRDLESDIDSKIPHTSVKKHQNQNQVVKLTVQTHNATIKIEPNQIIRGSLYSPEEKILKNKAVDEFELSVKSRVLSFADLYGGKICAALDRQHPRDLFDIRLLLENEGITKDIKNAFLFYLISHSRPMIELLDPNYKDIQEPFKKEFEGMTTIKMSLEKLIKVRSLLIKKINNALNKEDKEFLVSINSGNPNWNLYSYPKIKDFPSVRWMLLNINRLKEENPDKHKEIFQKLVDYFSR